MEFDFCTTPSQQMHNNSGVYPHVRGCCVGVVNLTFSIYYNQLLESKNRNLNLGSTRMTTMEDGNGGVSAARQHLVFAYYVSGHGLGHATRVVEVSTTFFFCFNL